jgi:hypothetical protein
MTESPAALLRRAAEKMQADAKQYRPGGQDEQLRLTVADWLNMEIAMLPYATGDTASAIRIASAYLGADADA